MSICFMAHHLMDTMDMARLSLGHIVQNQCFWLPCAGGIAVPVFLVPSVAGLRHLSASASRPDTGAGPVVRPPHPQRTQPTAAAGDAGVADAPVAGTAAAAADNLPSAAAHAVGSAAPAAALAAGETRVHDLVTIARNLT